MEVITVVAKHTTMNNKSCTIVAFFDTSTYLFLLLLEISQHCLNCVPTSSK